MSGPHGFTYAYGVDRDPPSDAMRNDYVREAARFVKECVSRGASKVARVRVVVEFNDGSEVAHELTP